MRGRIFVASVVALATFAGSWWLIGALSRLGQDASLGIAGAVMAVVLFVLGFWVVRAAHGTVRENDQYPSEQVGNVTVGRPSATFVISAPAVALVVACCTGAYIWSHSLTSPDFPATQTTTSDTLIADLANPVEASDYGVHVILDGVEVRRTSVDFAFTVEIVSESVVVTPPYRCGLRDRNHRELWTGRCGVIDEGAMITSGTQRLTAHADVDSDVASAAFAFLEVQTEQGTILLPEAELRPVAIQ
jgi:hypothetical protein